MEKFNDVSFFIQKHKGLFSGKAITNETLNLIWTGGPNAPLPSRVLLNISKTV